MEPRRGERIAKAEPQRSHGAGIVNSRNLGGKARQFKSLARSWSPTSAERITVE